MISYKTKHILFGLFLLFPIVANAFDLFSAGTTFKSIIIELVGIINILIPILVAFAFIFFFWGLSKFILGSDNKEEIKRGQNYMLWGILALFILFSFRTLITFVINDLELGNDAPFLPTDGVTGSANSTLIVPPQSP
jgi:hypothetical protein